jgi:hypothetical protein
MQNFDSKAQQDRFNKEISRVAAQFIRETLCPQFDKLVQEAQIGLTATIDEADPYVINIHYPAAFSEAYIRPEVRLEIGPLASWVPSAAHTIRPYAFEVFPEIFENPHCPVVAIAAERTFSTCFDSLKPTSTHWRRAEASVGRLAGLALRSNALCCLDRNYLTISFALYSLEDFRPCKLPLVPTVP